LHPGVNELRAVAAGTAFVSKDARFRVSVAA